MQSPRWLHLIMVVVTKQKIELTTHNFQFGSKLLCSPKLSYLNNFHTYWLRSVSDAPISNIQVSDAPVLNIQVFDAPISHVLVSDKPVLKAWVSVAPAVCGLANAWENGVFFMLRLFGFLLKHWWLPWLCCRRIEDDNHPTCNNKSTMADYFCCIGQSIAQLSGVTINRW